jgi:hypothetical protein
VDVLEQTVGHQVLVALGIAELAVGCAPAGTGDAGLDIDHDVARLDQLVDQQGRQGVRRRRGIAARVGDVDLTLDLSWPDVGQAVPLDVAVVAVDGAPIVSLTNQRNNRFAR